MKKLLASLLCLVSPLTQADRLPLPADTPAIYREECGSCHLPYPPQLLSQNDWHKLMQKLQQHFGTDAGLNSDAASQITTFLVSNAGKSPALSSNSAPPRISHSAWFQREHRKISASQWQAPTVKSPANCEGCHRQAANGSFSEREIRLPESTK